MHADSRTFKDGKETSARFYSHSLNGYIWKEYVTVYRSSFSKPYTHLLFGNESLPSFTTCIHHFVNLLTISDNVLCIEEFILPSITKEGYTCAVRNSHCIVYIPDDCNKQIFVNTVHDALLYPKTKPNGTLLTPVVCITPHGTTFDSNKPAVVELMKTVELFQQDSDHLKLVVMFSPSVPSSDMEWN